MRESDKGLSSASDVVVDTVPDERDGLEAQDGRYSKV